MSRDPLQRALPSWLAGGAVLGVAAAVLFAQRRRPLRRGPDGRAQDDGATPGTVRNVVMAGLAGLTIRALETPLVEPASRDVQRRRLGLLPKLRLPAWLEVPLGVLLLDYTLYVWHVLAHKIDWLWRFHRVHHADLELRASTALRFHFAEMMSSVPWRWAQVRFLGTGPLTFSIWQTLTTMAILFHHSNVRLPQAVERRLCRFVMTPRMHGIHHSIVERETDSNWSTIFSWPDFLHRTHRLDVPQRRVTIGVPEYRDERELTLPHLLAMPFGEQREPFRLPDGRKPRRRARGGDRAALAP